MASKQRRILIDAYSVKSTIKTNQNKIKTAPVS